MNESKAFLVATAWRERNDRDLALPLRRAVAIVEQAFAERRNPGPDLASALAQAREADHARDEYVARLALQLHTTREAMRRPGKPTAEATLPAFGQTWSLPSWMAGRRRAA